MNASNTVTGVILAGGPASRFGGLPKGLQTVGGERIIDRVARVLRATTDRLLIVSNDPAAAEWIAGVPVATDVLPLKASVAGIHSALARAGSDVLVVAWDMPFVSEALLSELRRRLTGDAVAVVPWGPGGPEPVCASYAARALPHIEAMAKAGTLRLSDMVDALPGLARIAPGEVSRFGDPETLFLNVNSPDDHQRAEAIARSL